MLARRAVLYTIKPTNGLVSQAGIVLVSYNAGSAGPRAKSAYALGLLLDYMIAAERRKSQDTYTTTATGSCDVIAVATLDPAVWKFPETL